MSNEVQDDVAFWMGEANELLKQHHQLRKVAEALGARADETLIQFVARQAAERDAAAAQATRFYRLYREAHEQMTSWWEEAGARRDEITRLRRLLGEIP